MTVDSYYLRNKDVLLTKQNRYYQANKDKINENRRNGKKFCECGSSIPKYFENRHNATKKHINFITGVKSIVQEARELFYIHYAPETYENSTENNNEVQNNKN